MKRLIKILLYCFLATLIVSVVLLYLPFSKEFRSNYRKNVDCNTSWMYYRMYENKTPIDIAFVGTSHTGCGVNDSLISREVGPSLNVANLAYCTKGRNLHFTVIKNLLATKKPKLIVLEIRETESTSSHKDYSLMANTEDLLLHSYPYSFSYLENMVDGIKYRFLYHRMKLKNTLDYSPPSNYEENYAYVPFYFYGDSLDLTKHSIKNQKQYQRRKDNIIKDQYYWEPEYALKQIKILCEENSIPLRLLYLPSIGNENTVPLREEFYNDMAPIWYPPKKVLSDKSNWVDGEHFNYWGSKKLSIWLSSKIESTVAEQL